MVTALVDGVEREMTFITNNTPWSARTIAELYRARWIIEVFFKEIKQTLQLRDFVGTNEKAVKWQVWTGLLMHLLLRFLRHVSRWGHRFSRCVGIVRTALWVKTDLGELQHTLIANDSTVTQNPLQYRRKSWYYAARVPPMGCPCMPNNKYDPYAPWNQARKRNKR
jgi:hypothetical protein